MKLPKDFPKGVHKKFSKKKKYQRNSNLLQKFTMELPKQNKNQEIVEQVSTKLS